MKTPDDVSAMVRLKALGWGAKRIAAELGCSRRLHVRAFDNERQGSWFAGMESAFLAFGGIPVEVLLITVASRKSSGRGWRRALSSSDAI